MGTKIKELATTSKSIAMLSSESDTELDMLGDIIDSLAELVPDSELSKIAKLILENVERNLPNGAEDKYQQDSIDSFKSQYADSLTQGNVEASK
jgi:hypothetical protein